MTPLEMLAIELKEAKLLLTLKNSWRIGLGPFNYFLLRPRGCFRPDPSIHSSIPAWFGFCWFLTRGTIQILVDTWRDETVCRDTQTHPGMFSSQKHAMISMDIMCRCGVQVWSGINLNLVLLNSLLGRHWRWALGLNSRFLVATRCGPNCWYRWRNVFFSVLSSILDI